MSKYLDGLKAFWSSRNVRVSIAIFLGIVALITMISLASLALRGKGALNDKETLLSQHGVPAIELKAIGRRGNIPVSYFWVINPTAKEIKGRVQCCVAYNDGECTEERVTVKAHDVVVISLPTLTHMECWLIRP